MICFYFDWILSINEFHSQPEVISSISFSVWAEFWKHLPLNSHLAAGQPSTEIVGSVLILKYFITLTTSNSQKHFSCQLPLCHSVLSSSNILSGAFNCAKIKMNNDVNMPINFIRCSYFGVWGMSFILYNCFYFSWV